MTGNCHVRCGPGEKSEILSEIYLLAFGEIPDFGKKISTVRSRGIATTIIFLVVIRIFWRYTHPAPQLPNTMSPMMKTLAHIGHFLLYLMLLALPITGCLFSWSAGHPAPVLYLFEIPRLVQDNPDLLAIVKPLHIYISWFAGLLIAGHILAAIKHHLIDKDNVLLSMLRQPK